MVELLVVIAIIAILASLLLSAIGRSRDAAVATSCRNNLRQLGIGLNIYISDNGTFPTAKSDVDRIYWDQWKVALSPFVASGALIQVASGIYMDSPTFRCPSKKGTRVRVPPEIGGPPFAELDTTYGYNGYGSDDWDGRRDRGLFGALVATGNAFVPTRESGVLVPSNMFCIGDGLMNVGDKVTQGGEVLLRGKGWTLGAVDPSMEDVAFKRHEGKANFVFADGHTEFLRNTLVFLDKRPSALSRWNKDNDPHL
jgi:prepilin-type processing-associated H-X9-DG protein